MAENGVEDVVTSEYLRAILKGIDPWTFDPTALDVPSTSTVYHVTSPSSPWIDPLSKQQIPDKTFITPHFPTAQSLLPVRAARGLEPQHILEGLADTQSLQRNLSLNRPMREVEALMSPAEAARTFTSPTNIGGQVGYVDSVPRIGPYDLFKNLDEVAIADEMPGGSLRKGLGTAAKFLGPLNLVGAGLAANKYWNEGRPLTSGFAALSAAPGPAGWGGLALEGLSNVGAGVREGAEQLGEYLTSPENPLPGIFPEGTPDLTGNVPLQQDIRAEDSTLIDRFRGLYGPESLGENITDRTSQLTELASGIGTSDPNVMSQSAQTLIKSFTDDPSIASLVSTKGNMKDAVGEALDRFLPSAFGIRSAHATVSPDFDLSDPDQYERARSLHEIQNEMRQEDKDSEVRKLLDKAKSEILRGVDFDKPRPRGMPRVRSTLDQMMDLDIAPRVPGSTSIQPPTAEESRRFFLDRQFGTGTETRAPMVDTFEDAFPTPEEGPGWFSRTMSSIIPDVRASVSRDPGYERTVTDPTWFPPTTSSGSAMAETAGDRNYLSDIEKWRIQNEEKQDLSVEDMQAHDVRDHIDLVYGVRMESPYAHTDTIRKTLSAAGKILPDFMRDAYLTSSMGDSLEGIQNLVEDHTKGESLVTPSHIFPRIDLGDWSRGDPVPKDEAQEDIRHMLKDVVNNTLFTAARDAEISPMEIYENDNVVFDEGKFDVLAEALLDEKAHVDQLGAALELVRDAPEDERVVESFTEQGLIDIASQVESFAGIEPTVEWDKVVREAEEGFEDTATQAGLQAQAETDRRRAEEADAKREADEAKAAVEAAKSRAEK
jgi:hypothetical protein